MSFYLKAITGVAVAGLGLAGCNLGGTGTGTFSLQVTDAPVDGAEAVVVTFVGVQLQPANGDRIDITYDAAKEIDLLALQGGDTAALLNGETVSAGEYEWIRLQLDAEAGSSASYIQLSGQQHNLTIPSGSETGLKLVRGFTVPANGSASFTIDFDLRKSVVETGGANPSYILKPALRLVDNTQVGRITGTVSDSRVSAMNGDCSVGAAVYVYEGLDATVTDVGGDAEPVASALVDTTVTGVTEYGYTAAFLTEGDYTVSFTCDGDLDDPATGGQAMEFVGTQNVSVTADQSSTANF